MKVLLFTGGLDSVMLWRLLDAPFCVYVMQDGNPYRDQEMATIAHLQHLEPALDVSVVRGAHGPPPLPDGHVQHRNLSLLVAAAAATGATTLYLGSVRGESSPDKSKRFLRAASRALSTSEHQRVRVEAPLRRRTKAANLRRHVAARPADWPLLHATRSCYQPQLTPCGACLACYRRWVAWTLAGGIPEAHERDPWNRQLQGRDAWRYMRGTPVMEWPGMLASNVDAWRATRLRGRTRWLSR